MTWERPGWVCDGDGGGLGFDGDGATGGVEEVIRR